MNFSEKKKAVFLDRDGTLIIDKVYLNDPNQIEYLPGVFSALKKLRDDGFELFIVTNQSGVARGIVSLENLNEIHRRMSDEFAKHGIFFSNIYYAPFSVESNHWMRKPNPGMLETAAKEHGINLSMSWMIGDRYSDVIAGHRAGCQSILLEGVEKTDPFTLSQFEKDSIPELISKDISQCVDHILSMTRIDSKPNSLTQA